MSRKIAAVFMFVIIAFLAGCANHPQEAKEDVKLKVLVWNERIFNEKYGNFFRATHPNVDLQVISIVTENIAPGENLNQAVEKLITTENPDVVSLTMDFYTLLTEQGKLASLTPRIKKHRFNTSDYTPAVINYLTDEQSQIHGLTPTFTGTALYYNKKMFKDGGIPFPTDSMTWVEVFQLAQRFPNISDNDQPQFGYYDKHSGNPYLMALYLGESSGLSFYDNNTFTFSTESWENIFKLVTDCFKTRACYDKKQINSASATDWDSVAIRSYPFLGGNIAMAVDESSLYRTLSMNKERYSELDWGIVSLPINAEQPGYGNGVNLTEIFAIPTNSGQPEEAWELIEYVCGEDYAKLLPHVNPEELPARLPSDLPDESLKAFYNLEHISNTTIYSLRSLPKSVITKMDEVAEQCIADILADKTTVPEALELFERELQAALDATAR